MNPPKYYTIWKVVDKENNVWFEGKFGPAQNFIKEKKLQDDVELVPFMYEHDEHEEKSDAP